jgi:hypothetical protein
MGAIRVLIVLISPFVQFILIGVVPCAQNWLDTDVGEGRFPGFPSRTRSFLVQILCLSRKRFSLSGILRARPKTLVGVHLITKEFISTLMQTGAYRDHKNFNFDLILDPVTIWSYNSTTIRAILLILKKWCRCIVSAVTS